MNDIYKNEDKEEITRRVSQRTRKSAISNDYLLYLNEVEHEQGIEDDPLTFQQAMSSDKAVLWQQAMNEEIESMNKNAVWSLVELNETVRPIGCK